MSPTPTRPGADEGRVTTSDIANAKEFKGLVTARVPVVTEQRCGGGDRRQSGERDSDPDPKGQTTAEGRRLQSTYGLSPAPHAAQNCRLGDAKP